MGLVNLTEKKAVTSIADEAYIMITQQVTDDDGVTKEAVRRVPLSVLSNLFGKDIDFDEEEEKLYILNPVGDRLGNGTTFVAGITGLNMYTEEDENATQYLILEDANGVELCRTEFTVYGTGSSTAYTCRLINGMSSANMSIPSGQGCTLSYEFYEYYGTEQTTVEATAQYYVKTGTGDYTLVKTESISQGEHSIAATEYLSSGTNYFKIQVTGGESGTVKTLTFTINVVDIALTSTFSDTTAYDSSISFLYRVTGKNLSKTMYFYIDGELYDTVDIGTSHNTQLTETINLAKYGHGHHLLECWFVTEEGAKSPVLRYDIIFTTGDSTPIIASTFEETEITYGETISLQYVVYTYGSDYTSAVTLGIYTIDSDGEKDYYSLTELSNVVNQTVQTWTITDYPTSGTMYLEITAGEDGETVRTFEVAIDEIGDYDFSGVSTRLIATFSASGRSNNDTSKTVLKATYTSKDDITTTINGTLDGFNYNSNGWVSDDDGYPVLRISGGAEASIDLPFFASSWTDSDGQTVNLAGSPTAAGRTFEIEFRTRKVTDESKTVVTIWDDSSGIGIKIFPSKAYILSDAMAITTDSEGNILNKNAIPYVPYSSTADKVRLTFIVEQNGYFTESDGTAKQLIRIYVNGEMAAALPYSGDSFTTSAAKPVLFAESCILDVYTMRFYDYALDDAGVLKNYIADLPSTAEKIEVYDANNIVDDNDDIDFSLSIRQYTSMVITGTLSAYKGNKTKVGVLLYKPDGSYEDGYYAEYDYMETDESGNYGVQSNVQGTSSQYYLKKNYKLTFYKLNDEGVFKKVKVYIFDDRQPVNTICIKADYMSPDSANTGNANYWQSLLVEKPPPQELDSSIQTSVMGYPILVFQRDTEDDAPVFMGKYCLNNDKSNSNAFGLENDEDDGADTVCQKWEYLDNAEDICNWKTDRLQALRTASDGSTYPAWQDALESAYPDQGDLEDEGLEPNLDRLQMHYSWVVQRTNFLDASTDSGTGGTYAGVEYDTEYDLKFAIFKAEFEKHFNLHHTAHYFISNEVPLLVDNLSKNFFATMYNKNSVDNTARQIVLDLDGNEIEVSSLIATDGTGAVDISNVDWVNSTFDPIYPTLYDMDSCLGADNNGYDQFPYYAEMWDTYNGSNIVNGNPNVFWRLFYAAFYDEIKSLYCALRDTYATLSADLYLTAMIDDLTKVMPIVVANKDQRFKYIDAYEGGYYSYETLSWLYTSAYMYLVKSTMESYHRDFVTKRMAMLDSKYLEDSYLQDNFNLRVNRGQSEPEDLAVIVAPCQAMYCYTEWGNANGAYIGGKVLEGETVTMMPPASGNFYDIVVSFYGASHYKSLGDLSVLYPSKLQSLSLCENLTELILGSEADGYENSLLTTISDVSYLTMLKKLNICNLTALSGTVDLSNCEVIEEVYATGSAVTSVVFPQGGYMTTVHLPSTVTALEIVDHSDMADFQMQGYDNILRLRVENTPNIPTDEILAARGSSLTRIRLVGVDWTLEDESLLTLIADSSMKGKVIDATGTAVEDSNAYPTISGTVTIDRIQGSLYDALAEDYPNLVINYTTKYHVVEFVDWDGTVLSTQEIADGGNATSPATPTRATTEEYIYTFRGWSLSYTNVASDLTVEAQYNAVLQVYDVEYYENSDDTGILATVAEVGYGEECEYAADLPTLDGYLFVGWEDADGNLYEYAKQMPTESATIDADGTPQTIKLHAAWEAVEMPSTSKSFSQLTHGEKHFCEIAIQNGEADGCAVEYYEDAKEYIITDNETLVTATIYVGDYQQHTLYNGETITRVVGDFNHDYSDLDETKPVGVTYIMQNCLTSTRQMNPSYKHCFNYQIGDDEAIVSDNDDHSSATNDAALALLDHDHAATADEVAAGYVDITALGATYLRSIVVTHSDGTTTTWQFDNNGFYNDTDCETVETINYSSTTYSNTWYSSDLDTNGDNPVYKVGKMLQNAGYTIVDASGAGTGLYNSSTTYQTWVFVTNETHTFDDFGGIKFDTTGVDTLNTAENNQYNGTGVSRIAFMSDGVNSWNNFTEMSEGAIISVPVVEGDIVTVKAYGQSRNTGGWDNSSLQAWANSEFIDLLPYGIRNTLVPVCKASSVGNRSYAVQKGLYTAFCMSYIEMGSNTKDYPYVQEGTKYPIFTDNNSRIKYLADGGGAVCNWWERSPSRHYSGSFYNVYTSGHPNYGYYAGSSLGVCLGFCAGEATA